MWERLRIRERDRKLAMLFLGVLIAVGCFSALAPALALVGPGAVISVLGFVALLMVRRVLALRQSSYGPAPVGPLSPDEKSKARSKLVRPYSRGSRFGSAVL